jgi:hypothetical protein
MQQEAEKLAQSAKEAGGENLQAADESVTEADNTQASNEQPISQDDEDESEAFV